MKKTVVFAVVAFASLVANAGQVVSFTWHDNPPESGTGRIPLACDSGDAYVTASAALRAMNPTIHVESLVIPPGYSSEGQAFVSKGRYELKCTYLNFARSINGTEGRLGFMRITFISTPMAKRQLDDVRIDSFPSEKAAPYVAAFNCALQIAGSPQDVMIDVFMNGGAACASSMKKAK